MREIKVKLEAMEGDPVLVQNYRRNDLYEYGVILNIEVKVYHDGRTSPTYRVKLDRLSKAGNPLYLYVGNNRIESLDYAV